jgi:hypothetical protein
MISTYNSKVKTDISIIVYLYVCSDTVMLSDRKLNSITDTYVETNVFTKHSITQITKPNQTKPIRNRSCPPVLIKKITKPLYVPQ